MTAALVILAAWQAIVLLLLLAGARAGVVVLHVRRPPKPRNQTEATP